MNTENVKFDKELYKAEVAKDPAYKKVKDDNNTRPKAPPHDHAKNLNLFAKIWEILQHDFSALKACLQRDLVMSIVIGLVGTIVGTTAELLWFEHSGKVTSVNAASDCAGKIGQDYVKCIASDTTTFGKLFAQWTAIFFIPGYKSFSPVVKGWVGFVFMLAEMKLMSIFSMQLLLPIFKRIPLDCFRYSPLWSYMYQDDDFDNNLAYMNGKRDVVAKLKALNDEKDFKDGGKLHGVNGEELRTLGQLPADFCYGVYGAVTWIFKKVRALVTWVPMKLVGIFHKSKGNGPSTIALVTGEIVSGAKTLIRAPVQSLCFILCYLPVAAMYNFCWFCFHLGPDGGIFHSEFTMGKFLPEFIMGTGPLILFQDGINWIFGAGTFSAATGPDRKIDGFVMPAGERLFWNVVQAVALSTGIFWFMRESIAKKVMPQSKLWEYNCENNDSIFDDTSDVTTVNGVQVYSKLKEKVDNEQLLTANNLFKLPKNHPAYINKDKED